MPGDPTGSGKPLPKLNTAQASEEGGPSTSLLEQARVAMQAQSGLDGDDFALRLLFLVMDDATLSEQTTVGRHLLHTLKSVFDAAHVAGDPNPRATLLQEVRDLLLNNLHYWKAQRESAYQFDRRFRHAEPKSQLVYDANGQRVHVEQQGPKPREKITEFSKKSEALNDFLSKHQEARSCAALLIQLVTAANTRKFIVLERYTFLRAACPTWLHVFAIYTARPSIITMAYSNELALHPFALNICFPRLRLLCVCVCVSDENIQPLLTRRAQLECSRLGPAHPTAVHVRKHSDVQRHRWPPRSVAHIQLL